jgi:hypothetical protein
VARLARVISAATLDDATGAAETGMTRVITQNDDANAPMLAINRRLGCEPFAIRHGWTLDA